MRAIGQPHGAAGAAFERAALGQATNDFRERLLALAAHRDIDRGLEQAFASEHRRMPPAPDDRQIGPRPFGGARHLQRIGNRRPGQDRDTADTPPHRCGTVWCFPHPASNRPSIVDDLVDIRVELGADREQCQRHGEEYRLRVVEHDLEPPRLSRCAARFTGCQDRVVPSCRPLRSRQPELEHCQLFVDEAALGRHRDGKTVAAKLRRETAAHRRRSTAAPARMRRGLRCAPRPAANRSATSSERQARSRSSCGAPCMNGGLNRMRSKRSCGTGANRSPWRTSIRCSR